MRILLSNDDGYNKIGILVLKEVLKEYGDVYISAPLTEKSGASVSITFELNRKIETIDDHTIAVDGTPADSVNYGLSNFKPHFDLVVTGINNGFNESFDTLFSGTIGGGLVASLIKVKTICVSASRYETYESLKKKTKFIIDYIFKNDLLESHPFINVNLPDENYDENREIKVGRIYNFYKYGFDFFDKKENIKVYEESGLPLDFDRYLTAKGYYSITPLRNSIEENTKIELFKKIIERN